DVNREATVTIPLPPHLEAEPDVAGFEDVCATVVFDGVPLGYECLSRADLYVRQDAPHLGEVGCFRDFFISGPVQHLRELLAQSSDGPANGITIGDRIY